MFHAPPIFLILTLTLVHSSIFHAIPVSGEQSYQANHQITHSDSEHSLQPERHEETPPLAQSQHGEGKDIQERATAEVKSESISDDGDELFKDISPKALAAVLLQALNTEEVEQAPRNKEEKPSVDDQQIVKQEIDKIDESELTERVRSRTRSSDDDDESLSDDGKIDEGDMETVKSLLQELEAFKPPPKREQEPDKNDSPENDDLQEIREMLGFGEQTEEDKRSPLNPVPHTSRRLGEEDEGDRLANVAQDLLLQYLINEGENEEEKEEDDEENKENEQDYQGEDFGGDRQPLFEDEEENTLEKRSTEDDDEVDPQTIDKLIELSSRLHLPADDVVDIINDVEKRKRRRMKKKKARDDFIARRIERTRTPPQSWPDSPKATYYPRRRLEQEPSWNKVSDTTWKKSSDPTWNKNKLSPSTWNKLKGPIWTKSSRSNWNKESEPIWNKVSDTNWNKVPDSNWNKVPNSNWNKVPDSSWNKMPDSSWNKVPDSNWNKGSDSNWNKGSDSNWNKVPDSNWNKFSKPSWNKLPDSRWNKVPDSNWNKLTDPGWNKVSDSNWNKIPDSNWNKVSEPSWNKVSDWNKLSDPTWNKMSEPNWNKLSDPSWRKVPESSWNDILKPTWNKVPPSSWNKYLEPVPRRYRSRPLPFAGYMRPRPFQTPPRYYYKPPAPPNSDYFAEDQDKQEEMENYIERILMTHPEVFQ
ncbi:PREDICTED: neurosecretory protein VGF [Nanorana parkeri]|uniref:neurosecretory protein VGF n=1 Tax=Nanorana parkeri TaxID=125878 RepID=UPI00085428B8|nr:PREDICTED: neurosecretory protein VGF [Nanorana parkeri]